MGIEIERKFLIDKEKWDRTAKPPGIFLKQGYLLTGPNKTIRIRITENRGFLTIKGLSAGAARPEFEYEIPKKEAKELLDRFAEAEVEKIRYNVIFGNKLWEVDEFLGANKGLWVAEIELKTETETFEWPDWIGKEITGDEKYYNSSLSVNPFKNWT